MITTARNKKIIVVKMQVERLERNKTFEIRLPANIKKVSSITITNSL